MKTFSLVLSSLGMLFFLSSCTYDPYYGHTSGSVSVGSYYGGVPTYGHSLIRTTHSRWAYDPYRRCYYDNHYRRYYNPVSYSYYSSPPRRYSKAVYPHGYRHGHGRISAPRYDSKKVRLPSRALVNRHHDRYRDRTRHDSHRYERSDRDRRYYRDQRSDRDRKSRDQRTNATPPRRDNRSSDSPRTRTREIQTARHLEAERSKARESMMRQRIAEARKAHERRSVPVSTPRNNRSIQSNQRQSRPSPAPTRSRENRGRQRGDESRRGRSRSKERS